MVQTLKGYFTGCPAKTNRRLKKYTQIKDKRIKVLLL